MNFADYASLFVGDALLTFQASNQVFVKLSAPMCMRKSISCTFFVVSSVMGFVLIGMVKDWSSM